MEPALGGDIRCPDLARKKKRVLGLDPLQGQFWETEWQNGSENRRASCVGSEEQSAKVVSRGEGRLDGAKSGS